MLLNELENGIKDAVRKTVGIEIDKVELMPTDPVFGDLSTNIALKLAAQAKRSPLDLAKSVCKQLESGDLFDELSVAGPGFINLRLSTNTLFSLSRETPSKPLSGRKIVASPRILL